MIGQKLKRKKSIESEEKDCKLKGNKNNNKNEDRGNNAINKKKSENNLRKDNNKKGINIKELKSKILKNENFKVENEKEEKEKNNSKYPKYENLNSDSESEQNENEIIKKIDLKESDSENENIKERIIDKNYENKEKIKEKKKYNSNKDTVQKSHPEFTKSTKTNYTLSVLIPSSIVDNAQSKELRTYLIGEIARILGIFKISEVIVFHDKLKDNSKDYINYFIKNLQYLETPQYLRKTLFPLSEDLKLSGLMNPLESQHHLRKDEWSPYREGCVLNRPVNGEYSWVNIGLDKDCKINQKLPPKTRVTVKLNEKYFNEKLKFYTGVPVSMSEPFIKTGTYWGYIVRVCESYSEVLKDSIFQEGYDFIIGTSDKGENYQTANFKKKKNFKHCLIVFGGITGIEGMMNDDEHNNINEKNVSKGFDLYLNTCMNQGLRTIRTEEAILITLAVIRPELDKINEIKEKDE